MALTRIVGVGGDEAATELFMTNPPPCHLDHQIKHEQHAHSRRNRLRPGLVSKAPVARVLCRRPPRRQQRLLQASADVYDGDADHGNGLRPDTHFGRPVAGREAETME